jgi:hypothetical protein
MLALGISVAPKRETLGLIAELQQLELCLANRQQLEVTAQRP